MHPMIFLAAKMISFAGQQNPTCGTTLVYRHNSRTENLHGMNRLRQSIVFGTRAAKGWRVLNSYRALISSKYGC